MTKLLRVLALGVVVLLLVLVGLAAFAAATFEDRMYFPDTPAPDLAASTDPAIIERGRYLVHGPAHCAQCHSTADRAHPEQIATAPLDGGLAFEIGPAGTRYARNLTPDETGIGPRTDAELARAMRTGVMHDGALSIFMRFSAARLADEDIVAVISYLRSLEPVKNEVPPGELTLIGKMVVAYFFAPLAPRTEAPAYVPAAAEPSIARGRYLADSVMLCTMCHSRFDERSFETVGERAGGGNAQPSAGEPGMVYVPPNLTAHATGYTGKVDEETFVKRMKAGRVYPYSVMPWENVQATTESDLRSVYRYLRTLPPVDNDAGASFREAG